MIKNKRKIQRITFYERERIELHLRTNQTIRKIGKLLKRDHSIISREIKRNSGEVLPYTAIDAQYYSERRSKKTNKKKLEKEKNKKLKEYVIEKLKIDWSPEQISGRLKEKSPNDILKTVSHETIYEYIYNGEGKFERLYHHLRTKKEKRQRRFSRKIRDKINIPNRISIHEREEIADKKQRIGDWETDSMIFTKKDILSTQYERKSMLCRIHKCENKTADKTEQAIWKTIESLPSYDLIKTITRDNGSENANHEKTKEFFNVQSYFCDPYCSWQKGGDENLNKLIRQYLPKRTNLDNVNDKDIYEIQELLNNRPRKTLNYKTPNEIIAEFMAQDIENVKSGALNP